ncbi:MAG TPA: isochorismatase family cysteine hydrolase [Candidatus Paceibacterota bacterium]|jgi:nicotinamidase-related amidase
MEIQIPNPGRKRALIVVDFQPRFINDKNEWVRPHIKAVIENGKYDVVVESTFSAAPGSIWDKQVGSTAAHEASADGVREYFGPDTVRVRKSTKSAFKGDVDLASLLKEQAIEEVHVVGLDTHDCVLATAGEAFDLGFFAYVLEECTASSKGEALREPALAVLREVAMTNRSTRIDSFATVHA